jgi:hypothetical protein
MDTSKRYESWTLDNQAQDHFQPGKLYTFYTGLIVVLMVGWVVYAVFLKQNYPLPSWAVFTGVVVTFGSFLMLHIQHKKTKEAPVLCTMCGKPMDYVECNPPEGTGGFFNEIKGEEGRVYVEVSRGSESGTDWHRFFVGYRECEQCKRYIMVTPQVLKRIGGSKEDVYKAEKRAIKIDNAQKNLGGKKIVINKPPKKIEPKAGENASRPTP